MNYAETQSTNGVSEPGKGLVIAIEGVAEAYHEMRSKPSMDRARERLVASVAELVRLADDIGLADILRANLSSKAIRYFMADAPEIEMPDDAKEGYVYPWHDLKVPGDSFRFNCAVKDELRVQKSISAAAWRRYGPKFVKTKAGKGCVVATLMRRIEDTQKYD